MKRRRRKKETPQGLVEVSQVLESALRTLGVRGDWDRFRLEGKCRDFLGPEVSKALTGVEEKNGVVTLYFNHSAFLQDMGYRRAEFLRELQAAFPRLKLKDIRATLSKSRTGHPPR